MNSKTKRFNLIIVCLIVFVSFSVIGCSIGTNETETSLTRYDEADLMTMYDLIHEAIPILDTQYEYTSELNEPAMYINLYLYNTERLDADINFEELTLDEIKDYLLNGEITLDYLNENWELLYLEKCEYGMSNRVKDYFEWYWGEGAYKTDDYDSNSGTQKLESYRSSLEDTLNDLNKLYPDDISIGSINKLNLEQTKVLVEYNGQPEAIQGDDLDLFVK